jgi:hypothetical protein
VQHPGAPIIEPGDQVLAVAVESFDASSDKLSLERAWCVRDRQALGARVDPHAGERSPDE